MNAKLLKQSLLYLHVGELRSYCHQLELPPQGKKSFLISKILQFLATGEKLLAPQYPAISCAKGSKHAPLQPNALMLKGSYKNDLKTRNFFKQLIGEHFHFTAFGIDWLEERWLAGNPPTYQEFAQMWQQEHTLRQQFPAAPKEEWAYINFTQQYLKEHPSASRIAVLQQWEAKRLQHKAYVEKVLAEVCR